MKNLLTKLTTKAKFALAGTILVIILALIVAISYFWKKEEHLQYQYEIVDFEKHAYIIYTNPKHESDTVIYFKCGDMLITLSGNWSIKRTQKEQITHEQIP